VACPLHPHFAMKWTALILGLGLFTSSGPPASSEGTEADGLGGGPVIVTDSAHRKPAKATHDSTRAYPKIVRPVSAGEPHLERRKPPRPAKPKPPSQKPI